MAGVDGQPLEALMSDSDSNTTDLLNARLAALSEAAQMHRRNAELGLSAYGLFTGSKADLQPLLPETARMQALRLFRDAADCLSALEEAATRLLEKEGLLAVEDD